MVPLPPLTRLSPFMLGPWRFCHGGSVVTSPPWPSLSPPALLDTSSLTLFCLPCPCLAAQPSPLDSRVSQASVFSISGMIRPPLPWLILVAVTFQGGNRPSVHGPLSVALPRQVLFLWLFLCTSR